MPDLHQWLYWARTRAGFSQEGAARQAEISYSYLRRIERQQLRPTRKVLDNLTAAYRLDQWQRRHTRELWEPSAELLPADELRHHLANPRIQAHLHQLDLRSVPSAHLDPLANVLHGNRSFHLAVPDLGEAEDNLALWLFSRTGRRVVAHWEYEARECVTAVRAALGRYRDTRQAQRLMTTLRTDDDFARLWASTRLQVSYNRHCTTTLRPLSLDCPQPLSISFQLSEVADRDDILVAVGIDNHAAAAG
ncbi:helix-turn-helix domain-containing protein [Nocardia asteroides]|uniref:helix-turn-helix domain-containing protein n=1 Tax=Nocardia asteroides TaxID=1824 RepID=UPI001E4961DD|nr:helix-turn-helix domain-containing protein [Nocardia asteroides]UGT59877.1 helix-turn-helix transcriptional regulator [Nocardia asteroides]